MSLTYARDHRQVRPQLSAAIAIRRPGEGPPLTLGCVAPPEQQRAGVADEFVKLHPELSSPLLVPALARPANFIRSSRRKASTKLKVAR